MAQRVMSAATPQVKFPFGFTLEGAPLWTRADIKAYASTVGNELGSGRERAELRSKWFQHTLIRRRLVALSNGACRHCWLLGSFCVCRSLPKAISPPFADAATGSCKLLRNRMKVTLVMNLREVPSRHHSAAPVTACHSYHVFCAGYAVLSVLQYRTLPASRVAS